MAISMDRHSMDPNLHTHPGTIRLLGRHPAIVFVQGLLHLLGDMVQKQSVSLYDTTLPPLKEPPTKDRTLTGWLEDALCLGPSQSLAPWT